SDTDIPLYFGDPLTTTERYFASSKYLMSLAEPEVENASKLVEAARGVWVAALQSHIQEDTHSIDERRRYGDPILQACGLVQIDAKDVLQAFGNGQLSVDNCYLDLSRPECGV